MINSGTGCSETTIKPQLSLKTIATTIEVIWIRQNSASLRSHPTNSLQKIQIEQFLNENGVRLITKPFRRQNNTKNIERMYHAVKRILEGLQNNQYSASEEALLSKAMLSANVFSGLKVVGSFQPTQGYKPALLGVQSIAVPSNLLDWTPSV